MYKYREGKVKRTPKGELKEPEIACLQAVRALCPQGNVRERTFCIMNRRLNVRREAKPLGGAGAKASPKRAISGVHYNPKPGDLLMVRLKRG